MSRLETVILTGILLSCNHAASPPVVPTVDSRVVKNPNPLPPGGYVDSGQANSTDVIAMDTPAPAIRPEDTNYGKYSGPTP